MMICIKQKRFYPKDYSKMTQPLLLRPFAHATVNHNVENEQKTFFCIYSDTFDMK